MTGQPHPRSSGSESDPIRPFYYSDAGVRVTLEALRGIAVDEHVELRHSESGVTLRFDKPEERLSIIANALGPVIDHLKERDDA